jgi:hypothetical protein
MRWLWLQHELQPPLVQLRRKRAARRGGPVPRKHLARRAGRRGAVVGGAKGRLPPATKRFRYRRATPPRAVTARAARRTARSTRAVAAARRSRKKVPMATVNDVFVAQQELAGDAAAGALAAAEAVAASVDLVLEVLALSSPRTAHRAASVSKGWQSSASPLLRQLAASTFHPPYLKKWWSREVAATAL